MNDIDLDAIRTRAKIQEEWGFVERQASIDRAALIAEVERLTRIIDGYDRTPSEQRAADAEAEVERLRVEADDQRRRAARHPRADQ